MSTSLSSCSIPVVARLLLPDDANVSGNVHGGTILQLMEQAGMIAATRHVNNNNNCNNETAGQQMAGLARIETMTFHQPMFVGEIASVFADVCFTSERSVLVQVAVRAENAVSAQQNERITNTGLLWYVSYAIQRPGAEQEQQQVVAVPQVPIPNECDTKAWLEYQRFQTLYDSRKHQLEQTTKHLDDLACLQNDGCFCPSCRINYQFHDDSGDRRTPTDSHQRLCQLVLPSDCGTNDICFGGFVMKLMDNAAGCCAFSHCRTNVVTVSISSMDFQSFVRRGDIVTIDAILTYCSTKSMEISVSASVVSATRKEPVPVARGTFTFVSLDAQHKVVAVPPLRLETKEQVIQASAAQQRYEAAKKARFAKAKQ